MIGQAKAIKILLKDESKLNDDVINSLVEAIQKNKHEIIVEFFISDLFQNTETLDVCFYLSYTIQFYY